ncbi:NADH:ubiquinone oxidoreductase subunit NDUFA12 [Xanthobacter tagetidis]|uniref:NADH:ubiquinone oxidoreductase subunit NDUFA12 n=1 Tax=Xanthobacter tagetidis TaxID=60216 RepID=A0A3L7A546_9HYPH|nr:NADH:ubiquinone oxidoreductase subunit NDUFA12 [Xanthobacter tagetidis]MBB6307707.1 NADH:ubiquinone oxidoreductase subunit [Xanthobacter tagetidis]RLP74432.1 NADH:ubiquinone oxidoreductase subunit NDUFA12 [Xanthobacter tagetidis]
MKTLLLYIFTWWEKQTVGTWWWTRRFGEHVGDDAFGNRYYRTKGGAIDPALGFERRWVIYNGYADASTIPPGWWGWIHHRVDTPPSDESYAPRDWQKPHRRNMTGTPGAYRPKGSVLAGGMRPRVTGDYKAWTPGE